MANTKKRENYTFFTEPCNSGLTFGFYDNRSGNARFYGFIQSYTKLRLEQANNLMRAIQKFYRDLYELY